MNNNTHEELSAKHPGSIWFTVFVIEWIVIFLINTFTILIFARNHHLCKRTTYLIINLTVADLLAGAVSGPLEIFEAENRSETGFSWQKFISSIFISIFTISSLCNLSLISLERLQATLYPFRHCLIGKWSYLKAIICSWLLALLLATADAVLYLFEQTAYNYAWASHIVLTLLILTISYVLIVVKVHNHPPPQPFGAVSSDRKLSVTLFIVTVASILTILPWAIYAAIESLDIWNKVSKTTQLHIFYTAHVLYYACSLVNPLVYAIRMQEFREAVKKEITCRRASEPSRFQPIELAAL